MTISRALASGGGPCEASEPKIKAPPARAKSVIFLYQFGGPSHIDMFDMKPDAPDAIRGPHKPIPSNVPGIHVSEHLPRVAKIMDKVTLIRSMTHTMKNHNSASYYALTGHAPNIPILNNVLPKPHPKCPLTGAEPKSGTVPDRPALAIKVENLPEARPQAGLQAADVIYEEPVEGGITRFIVIFQCRDSKPSIFIAASMHRC